MVRMILFRTKGRANVVTALLAFTNTDTATRAFTSSSTTSLSRYRFIQTTAAIPTFSYPFLNTRGLSQISQTSLNMKKVLVPIGDGSEEIETTCISDTLVRFGADVTVATVMGRGDDDLLCKMSRGLKVMADTTIEKAVQQDWDLIVLPGGMPGSEHLRDCKPLIKLLKAHKEQGKLFAAICAAPAVALASNDLIPAGAAATCFPAPKFRALLPVESNDPVVVADNLTTSQGPGTALLFALQLGENLYGKAKRDEIAKQLLIDK